MTPSALAPPGAGSSPSGGSDADPSEVDVVVVGAGPAGAVAALVLAHLGRRVALLGPLPQPRRIGEALPGAARPLLKHLGLLKACEAAPHRVAYGNVSAWGAGELQTTDFILDPHGLGWHLDRARFDADLLHAAKAQGAEHLVGRLLSANYGEGGWQVRWLGGRRHVLKALWLIEASGRAAVVARRLGVARLYDDELRAVYAWTALQAEDELETRTLVEAAPGGWWYSAPLPDHSRVIAFHTDQEYATELLCQPGLFDVLIASTAHIKRVVKRAPITTALRLTEACGAVLEQPVGAGWVAAGDAALAFDPLSSQGLFNSLYTGMRAGEAVAKTLAGDAGATGAYAARLGEVRKAYLAKLDAAYRSEQRFNGMKFWQRRHKERGASATRGDAPLVLPPG